MNVNITSAKSSDQSALLFSTYGLGEEELEEKDYVEYGINEESFYNYLEKIVNLTSKKHKHSDNATIDVESKLENADNNFLEDSYLKNTYMFHNMPFWFLYRIDLYKNKHQYPEISELENTISNEPEESFTQISNFSPNWIPRTSTFIDNFQSNIISYDELMEYNIIVRMPPKRRYTINLQVMDIRKAKPKIVEPEEILTQQ